jgi:hypothetical protein
MIKMENHEEKIVENISFVTSTYRSNSKMPLFTKGVFISFFL